MPRLTIAQLREKEVDKLVLYKTDAPTGADYQEARRVMNSFYRLCGLCERNLYLTNTERTCNLKSTAASEQKESRWYERLNKQFNDLYGLSLCYCGYFPSIGERDERGGFNNKITLWFY